MVEQTRCSKIISGNSKTTQLREVMQRLIDAINAGNTAAVMELYADGATVEELVGGGKVVHGRSAITDFYDWVIAHGVLLNRLLPIRPSH